MSQPVTGAQRGWRAIPGGVWALGLVSLFMDLSSEAIHSLLPVFLVTVLGASVTTVGAIEGIAEATASVTKVFSGTISDWLGRRKLLAVLGYGLAALSKPLFALAPSAGWVLAARFADRIGKGIRGAPRDALVGDLAPAHLRGACYGLRQSLDTVGAFAGPLLAIALMAASGDEYRFVFWVATVPALLAVGVLALGVREPVRAQPKTPPKMPLRPSELARLGSAFWGVVAVAALLTLARFSEAFLVLRAQGLGLAPALAPLVFVAMNAVYAASAYPLGAWSDRVSRRALLAGGFALLIAADAVLASAHGLVAVFLGVGLWGLHMGATQGLLAALVAETAPAALRGTAFGLFHLVSGLALLAASVGAGVIWDAYGAPATFATGGVITALGLAGLLVVAARRR